MAYDDPYGQWTARYLEGISYLRLGRYDDALDSIQHALAAARQCSNPRAEGPVPGLPRGGLHIRRRDRLSGVLHEYRHTA